MACEGSFSDGEECSESSFNTVPEIATPLETAWKNFSGGKLPIETLWNSSNSYCDSFGGGTAWNSVAKTGESAWNSFEGEEVVQEEGEVLWMKNSDGEEVESLELPSETMKSSELKRENAVINFSEGELPLETAWTFWFDKKQIDRKESDEYIEGLKQLGEFNTVEGFHRQYAYLQRPALFPCGHNLFCFRQGYKPMWEEFPEGGCWIVRVKKNSPLNVINRMWENLLFACIGEAFEMRDVVGCVLSTRYKNDVISVWNISNQDNPDGRFRIGEKLKEILELEINALIQYKEHMTSMRDFSTYQNAKNYRFAPVTPEGPSPEKEPEGPEPEKEPAVLISDEVIQEKLNDIKRRNAEHETEVHFQKCYGVLEEIFNLHENFNDYLPVGFYFLDLGCAPGGFSQYLLDDTRCQGGFGVTLTNRSGGFPIRVHCDNFFLQLADLFEVARDDLVACNVDFLLCDAQYMRNNVAWDDNYAGVRLRSKQHGVWALLVKQLWLGLWRLNLGGVCVFRFGWKDVYDDPTQWYKRCSYRLFTLLMSLFVSVSDVKSDFFNAKHSSFYVVCYGFRKDVFEEREVAAIFEKTFGDLVYSTTDDYMTIEILHEVDVFRTSDQDELISGMLDRVNKLRLIHLESSKWQEKRNLAPESREKHTTVCVRPLAPCMSLHRLEILVHLYGRVVHCAIEEKEEGRTGVVVFSNDDQARQAVELLMTKKTFGDHVDVWMKN